MAKHTVKKISFPMLAEYDLVVRYFVVNGLHQEFVMPPKMTRRTMELGTKYSPDMVCTPFKTILGSMIESLESGADTLIMTMGWCRLGYYGELAEQILRDLGYEFDYINFAEYTTGRNRDYLKAIKRMCDDIHIKAAAGAALTALRMAEHIDEITDLYYQNCGFELQKGAYRKVLNRFFSDMRRASSAHDVEDGYARCKLAFQNIPIDKGSMPLRVGLIGEYFTIMDDFSNLDLEQTLADMGVEVHRWLNLTHRNIHYPGEKNLNVHIRDLCEYEMGPTSTANIWCAREYAEKGFDGLIHLKSAGCTPEIDIMPVIQRISAQYKIPVLYLTYDSQTSNTGLLTRIEAFYDMIDMRKRVMN